MPIAWLLDVSLSQLQSGKAGLEEWLVAESTEGGIFLQFNYLHISRVIGCFPENCSHLLP